MSDEAVMLLGDWCDALQHLCDGHDVLAVAHSRRHRATRWCDLMDGLRMLGIDGRYRVSRANMTLVYDPTGALMRVVTDDLPEAAMGWHGKVVRI